MPKILLINGNPKQTNLCKVLAEIYTNTCKSYNPNPDIEMRLRVQVTDVHRKSRKTKVTSLVMKLFLGFLGASRTCGSIVFPKSGFEYNKSIEIIHLCDLEFDMSLIEGYHSNQYVESDLLVVKKLIGEATHIVIICPVWSRTMSAKLKGLFDRILLPGFAFQFVEEKPLSKKLLTDKACRLVVTMESPVWYCRWIIGDEIIKMLKKSVLKFCGIYLSNVNRLRPIIIKSISWGDKKPSSLHHIILR